MRLFHHGRKLLITLVLLLFLVTTTACGASNSTDRAAFPSASSGSYSQLDRGNTPEGQGYGNWVVQTSRGLIKDAYVRDGNKLGVVIDSQVKPQDVRPLAKSLIQGFHRNRPNQDVTVLVYAPDKKLILTAQYDRQSNRVEYQ